MSWFDSSFSFAKSALNQAQKSIDKVLDIKEENINESPVTSNVTPLPPVEEAKSEKPISTPTSQTQPKLSTKSHTTPNTTNKAPPPPQGTSEIFESTWGLSDSTWGTPYTSPSVTKTSTSKDSNTQRSKVTPLSKAAGKTATPSGRSERQKKTRQVKPPVDHVTSTPVSEGGGALSLSHSARDSHGEAITPVKPVEQAVLIVTSETPPEDAKVRSTTPPSASDVITVAREPSAQRTDVGTPTADSPDGTLSQHPPQKITSPSSVNPSQTSNQVDQNDPVPATTPANELEQAPPTSGDTIKLIDTTDGAMEECRPLPSLKEDQLPKESKETVTENTPTKNLTEKRGVEPSDEKVSQSKREGSREDSVDQPLLLVDDNHQRVGSAGEEGCGMTVLKKDEEEAVDKGPKDVIESLKIESARLSELLEAREAKMVDMSRQLISLTEENQTIQQELAETREMGQSDVEDLRSEFTRRIGVSDKKLQAVTKERDSLRKQLQAVQTEQSQQKKSQEDSLSKLLQEKEEQIAQLMEEGEKLSKQELQSNKTIKKLRQKEKQNDQLLSSQKQLIEDLESKMATLKEQCKKREENERKYQESLAQLNTIAEQQAKELTGIKTERDGLSDKVRSLQTNLDNAYKELADLQKENAVTQTAAQEAAMSAQSTAKEELKGLLEKQKVEAQREKEAVLLQLEELRMTMTRAEQLSARKEDHLRQEISDLQERLQEAESRNQELTTTISQATKPLLRQIENIQAAHSAQATNWERVESNLTQRLVELQAQLSQSTEKERAAVEKEMTLQSKVTALESQASTLRQEKSQLLASEELIKAKLQTLEEEQHRESAKIEGLRTSFQQTVDDLRKDKEMLERQLEYERVRLEAESKKARLEAQEKERLKAQLINFSSLSRPAVGRQSSSGSVHSQGELLEHSLLSLSESGNNTPTEVVDYHTPSLRGASASAIERLQSLLKQKEGELSTAQTLVGTLERSRSAMADDLSSLSAENESLKTQAEELALLREKLQSVERKYEAMLQMYGEKAEEAEELKLDILDLKAMYRQQIDELLGGRR